MSKAIFHFIWINVFLRHTCIFWFDKNPCNTKYEPTVKAVMKSWGFIHHLLAILKEEAHFFFKEADSTFRYLSQSIFRSLLLEAGLGHLVGGGVQVPKSTAPHTVCAHIAQP